MGSLNVMPTYKSYFTLTTASTSLNTAISYVGGAAVAPFAGLLVDWRGRRECVYWSALFTLIGGLIQGFSKNIGMFIAGRCIVGGGMGLAQTAAPTLVAETTPVKYRGLALGMYYACWGVGTLIAAGVCYGVSQTNETADENNWLTVDQNLDPKYLLDICMAHPQSSPGCAKSCLLFDLAICSRVSPLAH